MDIKEHMKIQQWAADMADKQSSGLTTNQWCEMKGIKKSTFDYRCNRVRVVMQQVVEAPERNSIVPAENSVSQPQFAKVEIKPTESNVSTTTGIDIRLNNIEVHINPDSNLEHVRLVMEALSNA